MKIFVIGMFLGILVFSPTVWAGQVKIYDETRKEYITVDKMDCRVHKSKDGVTLGLKAGNLLFSFGPEVTFGRETRVKWEGAVQALVVRYEELCSKFNTGVLSKQEYERRLEEIDNVTKEAFEFQETKLKKVRDRAKDAFKDLNKETGRGGDDVEKTLVVIVKKIETIKPVEDVKETSPPQEVPKTELIEPAPSAPLKPVETAEANVFENDLVRVTVKSFQRSRRRIILEVWYENLTEETLKLASKDWGSAYSTNHRGTYLLSDNGEKWFYKEDTQVGNHYGGTELIPHQRLLNVITFSPEGGETGTKFTYAGDYNVRWRRSGLQAYYQQEDIKVILRNVNPNMDGVAR